MLPERGPLGKANKANIGKSKLIVPGFATAGTHIFIQDFPLNPSVSAAPENQYDDGNISICIDAVPLTGAVNGALDTFLLYGVVNWQIGEALFGNAQDANIGGGIIFQAEVLFDIHLGVAFTLPAAAAVTLKLRMVCISNAGFNAGVVLRAGPQLRVNSGYSYGTIDPTNFTCTQYIVSGNNLLAATPFTLAAGAPGGNGFITKPKFAQSCQVVWNDYLACTPIRINFDGFITSAAGWGPISLTGGTAPPPILPWPVDTYTATITNMDAGDPATFVKVISNLSL